MSNPYVLQHLCQHCAQPCTTQCNQCQYDMCVTCGDMKQGVCKRWVCRECFQEPLLCSPNEIPHYHGYPTETDYCTCMLCAKASEWYINKEWAPDGECPVANLVKDIIKYKRKSKAIHAFYDECRCEDCVCKVGSVRFVKGEHEWAWRRGLEK